MQCLFTCGRYLDSYYTLRRPPWPSGITSLTFKWTVRDSSRCGKWRLTPINPILHITLFSLVRVFLYTLEAVLVQ